MGRADGSRNRNGREYRSTGAGTTSGSPLGHCCPRRRRGDRALQAGAGGRCGLSRRAEAGSRSRYRGSRQGRLGPRCGRSGHPCARRRSPLQRRPRRRVHSRRQERDGLLHHGRLQPQGRCGGGSHAHAPSHQRGARGDGEIAARDDCRAGRRCVLRARGTRTAAAQFLFYREPLAGAGEAVDQRRQAHPAAAGRRSTLWPRDPCCAA